MKTQNNILVVHRNESFTFDKIIQNKDGSPYIISSKLDNPYWLFTVSTTRYEQQNRYIENWWLELFNFPRFVSTVPLDLKSFKISNTADAASAFSSFSDVLSLNNFVGTYLNGEQVTQISADDFVYYIEDNDGNREYKYWSINTNNWQKYECRITKLFSKDVTSTWVEQEYIYSISLVAGESMLRYLQSICSSLNIVYINKTIDELYNLLIAKDYVFDNKFNIDSPLGIIDTVKPILVPTELRVMSDINGGLYA